MGGDAMGGDVTGKVALLAIACNEAAYLAAFLHHHLALGFGPIVVAVNRSSDGTEAILRRVAQSDGWVRHLDGDAILARVGPAAFQTAAYRAAIDALGGEIGDADHIGALDIDEYWLPLDGSRTVQDYLARRPGIELYVFNWLVPDTDASPFCFWLSRPQTGVLQLHVKSIWRAAHRREPFNSHSLFARGEVSTELTAGVALDATRCRTETIPERPGAACVLHQMFRSRLEYAATLGRGRPAAGTPFKDNRQGWRPYRGFHAPIRIDGFDSRLDEWRGGYARFVETHGLLPLILAGRAATIERAGATLRRYQALPEDERAPFRRLFLGLDEGEVEAERQQAIAAGALERLVPAGEEADDRAAVPAGGRGAALGEGRG
jgi:hypothetical protein